VDPQRRRAGRRAGLDQELTKIREQAAPGTFDAAQYGRAVALFTEVALADSFADFLTIPAYERMP